MNRFKIIGSAFIFAPALALLSTQARAEFKCDAPPTRIDRVACEKAKESPQALRHYIQRMQAIENLQFSDYVNEERAAAWAQSERERAPAKKEAVQAATALPEHTGA